MSDGPRLSIVQGPERSGRQCAIPLQTKHTHVRPFTHTHTHTHTTLLSRHHSASPTGCGHPSLACECHTNTTCLSSYQLSQIPGIVMGWVGHQVQPYGEGTERERGNSLHTGEVEVLDYCPVRPTELEEVAPTVYTVQMNSNSSYSWGDPLPTGETLYQTPIIMSWARNFARNLTTTSRFSSAAGPLRICVVGSGPAGFYTAHQLIKVLLPLC